MSNEKIVVPFQNFRGVDGIWVWERPCLFKDLETARKILNEGILSRASGAVPVGDIGLTEVSSINRAFLDTLGWIENDCDGHLESIGLIEPIEPRKTESKG